MYYVAQFHLESDCAFRSSNCDSNTRGRFGQNKINFLRDIAYKHPIQDTVDHMLLGSELLASIRGVVLVCRWLTETEDRAAWRGTKKNQASEPHTSEYYYTSIRASRRHIHNCFATPEVFANRAALYQAIQPHSTLSIRKLARIYEQEIRIYRVGS
jgi:hypothetical protein